MGTVLKTGILLILLLSLCVCSAYGQEIHNPTEEILELAQDDADTLRQEMKEGFSLKRILSNIWGVFFNELKTMATGFPLLFFVLILQGMKNCMEFPHSLDRTVSLGCFSVTAVTAGGIFSELAQAAEDMITHLSEFNYLTIPALTGLVANGGRVLTAAKSTYFILGFINLLTFAIQKFFFPGLLLYFLFSVISALLEKDYFSALKSTLSTLIKTALPLLVGIFITVLGVITSVSKSADDLTIKTAKMALGNCIPFLGGVIADSGEYLIQTVSQIKAQAGLAGILVLCYTFLVPILKILAGFLLFQLLCVLSCLLSDQKTTGFYENASTTLGMLCGILGTVSMLSILGIMILMGL